MGVLFHSHSRRNFLDHNSIVLIVLVVRKMHFALESMVLVSMTFHNKTVSNWQNYDFGVWL